MNTIEKPFSIAILEGAKPENLIRLAKFLKLNVGGLSHSQLARLVHWRLTRPDMCKPTRFDTSEKRQDYESWWEGTE